MLAANSELSQTADVVKFGHLRRLKTSKIRFFVLRNSSKFGKARLEYFESEKKFALHSNPRRSILLGDCFNVGHITDKKYPHCFALFTKQDKFSLVASSEDEVNEWLSKINDVKKNSRRLGEFSLFDQVWFVIIKNDGLGASKSLAGRFQMALSKSHLSFLRENSEEIVYQLAIANVRRRGQVDHFFYLEISRQDKLGPGELWIEVEDTEVARNMYDVIFGLRRSRMHTLNGSSSSRRVSSKKLNHYIMEKGFRYESSVSCNIQPVGEHVHNPADDEHKLFPKKSVDHRFSQMPADTDNTLLSNGDKAKILRRPLSLDFELIGLSRSLEATNVSVFDDSMGFDSKVIEVKVSLSSSSSSVSSAAEECKESTMSQLQDARHQDASQAITAIERVPAASATDAFPEATPTNHLTSDGASHSNADKTRLDFSASNDDSDDQNETSSSWNVDVATRQSVARATVEAADPLHRVRGDSSCSTSCDEAMQAGPKLPQKRHSKKSRNERYEYEDMTIGSCKDAKGDEQMTKEKRKKHRFIDGYEQMNIFSTKAKASSRKEKKALAMDESDVGSYVMMGDFATRSINDHRVNDNGDAPYMNLTLPAKKQGRYKSLPRYDYIQVNPQKKNKETNPLRRASSADLLYPEKEGGNNTLARSSCVSMESLQSARLPPRPNHKYSDVQLQNKSQTLKVSPNSSPSPCASPAGSPASSPRPGRRRLADFTKHLRFRSTRHHLKKQLATPSSTFYVTPGKAKDNKKAMSSPESYRRVNSQTATSDAEEHRERSESRDSYSSVGIESPPSTPQPTIDSTYAEVQFPTGSPVMPRANEAKAKSQSLSVREIVSLRGSTGRRNRHELSTSPGYEEINLSDDANPNATPAKDIKNSKEVRRRKSAPQGSNPDYYINFSPSKLKTASSPKLSPLKMPPSAEGATSQRTSQRKANRHMMYSDITLPSSPVSPTVQPSLNDIPESGAAKAIPNYMNFAFNRSFSATTDEDEDNDPLMRSYENVRRTRRVSKESLSYAELHLTRERRTSSGFSESSATTLHHNRLDDLPQDDESNGDYNHRTLRNSFSDPEGPRCRTSEHGCEAALTQPTSYFEVDFMKSRGLADAVKSARSGSVRSDT